MRRTALLLAAAWLGLGAAPARAADGQIVGVAGGGNEQLVTVDPDGSNVNTLFVAGSRPLADPAWSPDGNRVAVAIGGGIATGTGSGIAVVDAVTRRVTVLTAHAAGVDDSSPSWSPDGSRIAFMRSDGSVRTVKLDGSGETTLPGLAGLQATWGPDGRFAFSAGGTVGVIDADGGGRHDLATGGLPQWSADGTRIVYTGAGGELRTVPAAGGASSPVSTPPPPDPSTVTDVDPDLAPDGDGVVFTSSGFASYGTLIEDSRGRRVLKADGLAQPDWQPCVAQTVRCTSAPFPPHPALPVTATDGQVAAVDGSTLFVFNPNPAATGEKVLFSDPGRALDSPEWSPDGNHIAFVDASPNGGNPRLMRYDLADGSTHTLVPDAPPGTPSWSADGTRIFVGTPGGVMSVRADGTDRRSYPDFPRFGLGAPVSVGPDGRFAYAYFGELGVFEPDGTNRRALTTTGTTLPPSWSPDGRQLVFIDDHGDTATVPADGGAAKVVGAGFYGDAEPEFSPDGHEMVLGHYQSGYGAAIEVDDAGGGHRRVIVPHGSSPTWQPCVAGVTVSCTAAGTGTVTGGGGGGAAVPVPGGGAPGGAHAPARLHVVSAFRLAHGRIAGRVRCDVAARLTLRLRVHGRYRGRAHSWKLRAGRTVTLRLGVARRWRHRKLTLAGTLTDAAGRRVRVTLAVKRRR